MVTAGREFIDQVCADRRAYRLPTKADLLTKGFVADALALLFPHFAEGRSCATPRVEQEMQALVDGVKAFPLAGDGQASSSDAVADALLGGLPALRVALLEDAEAVHATDPASRSLDEVILAYPGFYALACHRIAHVLHGQGLALLPRLVSELAHHRTGIDIHPAATIGRALAIDHGTGIVVGETSTIGDRVRLYQGVTLGALRVEKHLARSKRHPTLEDDVVIYANATILGGETVIGRGSVIGGNVWLTHSVPPGSIVTHVAAAERGSAADADI